MKASEIYSYLNRVYPFDTQEEWDNSRLVLNDSETEISRIIVCLDINKRVLELAIENNAQLIISHHPLFVDPPEVKNFHTRKIYGYLKKYKINAIFLHTPFDKSLFGMNVSLACKLDWKNIKQSEEDECIVIGDLEKPTTLLKYAHTLKKELDLDEVRIANGFKDKEIKRIALCAGGGSSLMYGLKGADAYITGDVKHHAWIDSIDLGIPILEINHNVENIFVDIIADKILELSNDFDVIKIKAKINFKTI